MNSKVLGCLSFIVGAAVGAAVTYELVKTKYETIANDEISEMKEIYDERLRELNGKNIEVSETLTKLKDTKTVIDYAKIIKENNYGDEKPNVSNMINNYIDDEPDDEEESYENYDDDQFIEFPDYSERDERPRPYVIDPEIFGEYYDYDTIELTYYADLVVANEDNEIVDNVNELIGIESLGHFGEFEEDAVHVRNDQLKADFEILKDVRKYSDVRKTLPPSF